MTVKDIFIFCLDICLHCVNVMKGDVECTGIAFLLLQRQSTSFFEIHLGSHRVGIKGDAVKCQWEQHSDTI